MKIRVINKSKHKLPVYSAEMFTGMNFRIKIEEEIILAPFEIVHVKTEQYVKIKAGYEAQMRPGRGWATNSGIPVVNSTGTIGGDYRVEISFVRINLSNLKFVIRDRERICRMVIAKQEKAEWIHLDSLLGTDRISGGFGHTGKE
jgi:dUTP pyrophosphatase